MKKNNHSQEQTKPKGQMHDRQSHEYIRSGCKSSDEEAVRDKTAPANTPEDVPDEAPDKDSGSETLSDKIKELEKKILKEVNKSKDWVYEATCLFWHPEEIATPDKIEVFLNSFGEQAISLTKKEILKMIDKRIKYWKKLSDGRSWYLIIKEFEQLKKQIERKKDE